MVIIMRAGADESSIQEVIRAIEYNGLSGKVMEGEFQTIIGVIGDREKMCCLNVESLE
ncbi:MAG: 3-deoxy-7-phosphoheptulonate synthase, partial [Anaerovibrio sp.]|nr:3-deoxy-7-phosphoheptulonate synthase [Anaerovibrio sp.]